MNRKRHVPTDAETLLAGFIQALEVDDAPLASPDPDVADSALRGYRNALLEVLGLGPLHCLEAVEREAGPREVLTSEEVINLRATLLQWLRSAVRGDLSRAMEKREWLRRVLRGERTAVPSTPMPLRYSYPHFSVSVSQGRAQIAAEGDARDLIVLQVMMLLHEVGLQQVRMCPAPAVVPGVVGYVPPCGRLFVKTYRREFCSVQCQKRLYARRKRRENQERKRRQRQRRKGA